MAGKTSRTIKLKRAYEAPSKSDGYRVLVDRVWPRGVTKDALRLDEWMKDLAPTTQLRKWFGHDPEKWDRFRERYFAELERQPDAVGRLSDKCRAGTVTLVFAARDETHSNAAALREYLLNRAGQG